MRASTLLAALVVVYITVPGSVEAAESLVHFVAHGHGAHALPDAEHHAHHPEHGCSPTLHLCACHGSTAYVVAGADAGCTRAAAAVSEPLWRVELVRATGHHRPILRPPID